MGVHSTLNSLRAVASMLALIFLSATAWAAPTIRSVGDTNQNYGQVGQWIMIDGEGFDGTTTDVLFTKSGGGTVVAVEKAVSTGRGIILCVVPVTAVTGPMVVRVNGVSSTGYPFTVNPGTFNPGINTVSGKVTASAVAVANTVVALLTAAPCDGGMTFWDSALTDAVGNYTVNWPGSGDFMLFLLPPRSANLAGTAMALAGSGNLVNQNVALTAGTTVTGRIVNASTVGIANAQVSWDGDSYDKVMTDSIGNFSLHLPAGDWQMGVDPPLNYHAIGIDEEPVTVPATTPYALGNKTLADGVWISGVLQDDTAFRIASADLQVSPQNGGNALGRASSLAGGEFGMEVPLNTALRLNVSTNESGPWVDYEAAVGPFSTDTALGTITLVRAGYVKGVVRDGVGNPIPFVGLSLVRADNGNFIDWAESCEDGSYTLKAPSAGTTVAVRASVQFWQDDRPYAVQTYNNEAFHCEGDTLNVTHTGTVGGVDFALQPGGSVSGTVSQYLGGSPLSGVSVVADDGASHACSWGGWPQTDGSGFYRIDHLPIGPLRVWAPYVGPAYSRGSYTNKIYPQYTPITPVAGSVTPNVNIALSQPTSPKTVPDGRGGTQAAKITKLNAGATLVQGTWDVTTCPPPTNHDYNLLVGAGSTLPTYGIIGSQCGMGRSGTFTGAMPAVPPGEKFLWFVIVQTGGNGSTESSWGKNSQNQERGGGIPSNQCQYTSKDSSSSCP